MSLPKKTTFTIDDIFSLPDGQRAERIDGVIFDMGPRHVSTRELSRRCPPEWINTSLLRAETVRFMSLPSP